MMKNSKKNSNMMFKDAIMDEMKISSALRDRRVHLSEAVTRESVFKVNHLLDRIVALDELSDCKKPIEIVVNSEGGYIYFGLSLMSKIESLKEMGYEIITTCDGIAMSMGFMILLMGSERRMTRLSTVMCHQPLSATWGKLKDMEEDVEETRRLWRVLKDIIIKHSNITDEQLELMYKEKRDWFMGSEEALELNVVDKII